MNYIRSLDGFRGWSIFMVMLLHFGLFDAGWIGVEFFFALSGFLITGIIVKTKDRSFSNYLGRFWWRRSLRIFPIYFTLIGFFILCWLLTGHPSETEQDWPYLLTYSINFRGIFEEGRSTGFFDYIWSLAIEEQFYLVWPLAVFLSPRKWLKWITGVLFVLGPMIRWLTVAYWESENGTMLRTGSLVYLMPWTQFDAFMIGGWVAVTNFEFSRKQLNWILGAALALFVVAGGINWALLRDTAAGNQFLDLGYPIANWRNGQYIWSYSLIHLVSGACLLQMVQAKEGRISRFFSGKFWVSTGRISYGIYLIHLPIAWTWNHVFPIPESPWLRFCMFPLFFAISYIAAWCMYEGLEIHFLKLKDRLFLND